MFFVNIKKIATLAIASLLLNGCTLLGLANKNKEAKPVEVVVLVTPSVNPDISGRPSPLRMDIMQLTSIPKFNDMDYLQLIDEDNGIGEQQLKSNQYLLHPDTIKHLTLELQPETNHIGVIAGYQSIDDSNWRLALFKQDNTLLRKVDYLYIKVDRLGIQQLSKKEMKKELKLYNEMHPEDERVTKRGRFIKPKPNYEKGVFLQN